MLQWFTHLFKKSPADQNSVQPFFADSLPKAHYPEYDQEAIVTMIIQPNRIGQVKYEGTWWNARCRQPVTLRPHERVKVTGRANAILLYVEPIDALPRENGTPHPDPANAPTNIAATAELNTTSIAPVIPLRRRTNAA